jgi:hypothetical protein
MAFVVYPEEILRVHHIADYFVEQILSFFKLLLPLTIGVSVSVL